MDSPYTPPRSSLEQPRPSPAGRPLAIRVFGPLHLISSGIGLIGSLAILHTAIFSHRFDPSDEPSFLPVTSQDGLWWHVLSSFLSVGFLIEVLLFIAGLKLERNRRHAIRASNRYALTSLCAKGMMIALGVFTSAPPDLRPNLIGMIYPLLSLLLLNRRPVKSWLESYGT